MSNNPEQQKLEPILKEVRPGNWQEILEKYERFSQAKRQELSAEIRLDEDQMEAVDGLVDDLTREGLDMNQKTAYVDTLEAMLDAQFGVSMDEASARYETEKDKVFGAESEGNLLSINELIESYKRVEALLPVLEESETLHSDAVDLMEAIEEEVEGFKSIELKKEIRKELEVYKEYIVIEEAVDEEGGRSSLQVKLTEKFAELDEAKQLDLNKKILELQVKALLKREEALLQLESRDYMRAFYQANQSLNAGDYKKAKDLYKKFLKHYEGDAGIKTESLEEPTVKRAIDAMKKIADLEIELVTGKLDSFSRSVKMIPRVSWNINKLGVSKDAAERMIEAQRKTLEAAKTLIKKNPSVLSLEDAITLIGGINEVQSQEPNGGTADEAYLINIGLCDSMNEAVQFLGDSNYGDWRSRGIAFYASKFGTDHKWGDKKFRMKDAKYVSQLDALGQFLETGGDEVNMTKEQLRQKAEHYQEVGLYDAAEQMYDKYFEGLYKYRTQRQSFEDYAAAFKKDPEKMEDIKEQIDKERERLKEKEGRDMSEEQREFLETHLIKEARKADIRANITENMKRSGDVDPKLAKEWDTYNDDYLQTDRHWYELWEVTNAEYDSFIETLPIDIVTLAISGGLASAAGKKMTQFAARKLAAEEFMKMGVREAFKEGGRAAAMKVIASRLAGFAVEAGVFSEMNMMTYALRTGDMEAWSNPKAHLKAWGHSAMVLGVLKAVDVPFAKLKDVPGAKAAIERVGGRILIDTVALSGMNVLTGMVSGDGQIAADIRNNILLSVGVRVGQGLASFGAKKFGGEGPKNPEGKSGKAENAAENSKPVSERVAEGGEIEMKTEKDLDQAFAVFDKEGYEVGVNERGEVKATKPGKPDVVLREGGELGQKRASLREAVDKAVALAESGAEPAKVTEAMESVVDKLAGSGVPKHLGRLIAAFLLIPKRAMAGDWMTSLGLIWDAIGNLPTIAAVAAASVLGWKTVRGVTLRGRRNRISDQMENVNTHANETSDIGNLEGAVARLKAAGRELRNARDELAPVILQISLKAQQILDLVTANRNGAGDKPKVIAARNAELKAAKQQLVDLLDGIPMDWFARNAKLPGSRVLIVLGALLGLGVVGLGGYKGINWIRTPNSVDGMRPTSKEKHNNPELATTIYTRDGRRIKWVTQKDGVYTGTDKKLYRLDDDGYAVEIKTTQKTKE